MRDYFRFLVTAHRWFMKHSADFVRTPNCRWTINGLAIRRLLYWPIAWLKFMKLERDYYIRRAAGHGSDDWR